MRRTAGGDLVYDLDAGVFARAARVLEQMGDVMRPAISRALNRTAHALPTEVTRLVRRDYHVPAGRVRRTFSVRTASPQSLEATVRSNGRPIGLYHFSARKGADGVTAAVMRGRKPVADGSFIAKMRSGHVGVWMRRSDGKLFELFGPGVPQMVATLADRDGADLFDAVLEKRFNQRLGHEVNRTLEKLGVR